LEIGNADLLNRTYGSRRTRLEEGFRVRREGVQGLALVGLDQERRVRLFGVGVQD
jgi:hypothetical protein